MFNVGDRVKICSSGDNGVVAYIGPLSGKRGTFYGLELDTANGRNDGSLDGRQYFGCKRNHGVFVREENIKAAAPSASVFGKYSAARSHELTESYMEDFDKGFKQLAMESGNEESTTPRRNEEKYSEGKHSASSVGNVDEFHSVYTPKCKVSTAGTRPDWSRGPRNPEGLLFDASDQPLLCASLSKDGRECVVGGCDHGLRVFEVKTGKEKRNLFTKKHGHREWVTSCEYCPDGSILSGGMDNKICLWRGVQCVDLEGHRGSISKLLVTSSGRNAISCSYDKSIRVWDLHGKREMACFTGHRAPILEMGLNSGVLVTGSRDGVALAWDIASGSPKRLNEGQHKGHVTSLHTFDDLQFASGDQAGFLRIWDLRTRGSTANVACVHPGGAVNEIKSASGWKMITAGADKKIVLNDLRALHQPVYTLDNHKDFIYSLEVTSRQILSGSGDGMLLVHNLENGRLCYGLGANAAGVRCIEHTDHFMVCAGDDGKAMTYFY